MVWYGVQVLTKHFGCEAGCHSGVAGDDLPNYVKSVLRGFIYDPIYSAPAKPEFHRSCLMGERPSGCDGSHWSSQRLCPCVPP